MGIIILLVVLVGGLVFLLFVLAVLAQAAQNAEQQRRVVSSNRARNFTPGRTPYNSRSATPVGGPYTSQRLGAEFNWERGSIVNSGFNKDCMVADVKTVPVLHYYLYTVRGREITFFPHKGVRSGWVDEY